jgi:hypothetical protein
MSDSNSTGAPDDVKAKFRQALDAKNRKSSDADPNDNRPEEHFDTQQAQGAKRMFRRKSGS